MDNQTAKESPIQATSAHSPDSSSTATQGSLLARASEAISSAANFFQWVVGCGIAALGELMCAEAEALAGPKGKHQPERTHNHWGFAPAEFVLGGRKITVERPRVRRANKGNEVVLPCVAAFQNEDVLPERVQEQILAGVSTRSYERSLEPALDDLANRGASKSAVSRHLIERTEKKMREYLTRRLENYEFSTLMVDAIHISQRAVIVCLGIKSSGEKMPLGIWSGSTENADVCTTLLNELLERGLKVNGSILCVIDGGRGIRKGLHDVFGTRAVIQRCQLHKRRNLQSHLPKAKQAYVDKQLAEAYSTPNYKEAKHKLQELSKWLKANGEEEACKSLNEGMEETLTLLRLGITGHLRSSLVTTNAIENLMGTIRRITRNVKRWRDGDMIIRWVAMALEEAETKFRKIKGYRQLAELKLALAKLDRTSEIA